MSQIEQPPGGAAPSTPGPGGAPGGTPTPAGETQVNWEEKARYYQQEAAKAFAERDAARRERDAARAARAPEPAPDGARPGDRDGKPAPAAASQSDLKAAVAEAMRAVQAEARIGAEIERAYQAAGGKPEYLAHLRRLADFSAVRAEGESIVGVREAMDAARRQIPAFFGDPPTSPAGEAAGRAPPPRDYSQLKPGDITRMSPDEYKAYKEAKQRANGTGAPRGWY